MVKIDIDKIVLVPILKSGECLYLYGFNKKGELVFRSSRNIEHLQTEPIHIDGNHCRLRLSWFSVSFLKKLPTEPIDYQI